MTLSYESWRSLSTRLLARQPANTFAASMLKKRLARPKQALDALGGVSHFEIEV
jgi:hypothetical protein